MPVGKGSIARATQASNISYSSVVKTSRKMVDIITEIPLHQIIEIPQSWKRENYDAIPVKELMKSIQTYGLLEPVILRRISEKQYQLLSGYRRLQAVREIGAEVIPSRIIENLEDQEAREIYQELHGIPMSNPMKLSEIKFEVISTISKDMPVYLL